MEKHILVALPLSEAQRETIRQAAPRFAYRFTTQETVTLEEVQEAPGTKVPALVELVLKAVALAMGVGVTALTIMDKVEPRHAFCLLGIGLACLALVQLSHTDEAHG